MIVTSILEILVTMWDKRREIVSMQGHEHDVRLSDRLSVPCSGGSCSERAFAG
jgi:hypothetical protein